MQVPYFSSPMTVTRWKGREASQQLAMFICRSPCALCAGHLSPEERGPQPESQQGPVELLGNSPLPSPAQAQAETCEQSTTKLLRLFCGTQGSKREQSGGG